MNNLQPEQTCWLRQRIFAAGRAFAATVQNRGLLRAQLAFAATWTAEAAFTVGIAVVAYHDGGAAAVGLVAFLRLAPTALITPVATAFADRVRRDRVLVWSSVVRALATGAAALVLATGGSHVAVYALAVLSTMAFRLFRPSHSALLPSLCTTPYELTSANIVRGLLDSISTLLGPLAAALLLEFGSPVAVFLVGAVLSLTSGLLLVGLVYEAPPRTRPQPLRRIAHETLEGFQALTRYRDAGVLIGLSLVQTMTQGFLNVFVVVLALQVLGMGEPGVGLLLAAVGAGAVASSLGACMSVSGRRLAALEGLGVILWGLPLTLSGAFPYAPVVLALMCVIGIGNSFVDIGLHTLPARLVPEELLARVFGVKASLAALAGAIGAFVTPFAIGLLGTRGALIALGLLAPGVAAVAWHRLRVIDAAVARRDREVEILGGVVLFSPLPMPAIDALALRAEFIEIAPGDDVVRQGEEGDRFYVIEAGTADVIGDGRLVRTLGSGDAFGEIALLEDSFRTATVRARTQLRLHTLPREAFRSTVRGYRSSEREADAVVLDRLGSFAPAQ